MDGHEEGEQYFVLLKQRAANVAIQIVHEVGVQNFEPFLEVIRLLAIHDREDEELDKPWERVLVHGLNVTHLCQKKKSSSSSRIKLIKDVGPCYLLSVSGKCLHM